MAAVCRRRATQVLSTSWRRGLGLNVVSTPAGPTIAKAHGDCNHQQRWISSLAKVEEEVTSVSYPPTSSWNYRSSIHYAGDGGQTGGRRRWLSFPHHLAASSSSFSSSSSASMSPPPPPSAALLLPVLPTQQRRGSLLLPLFSPSPSIACLGQGGPRGCCQARPGDGGNRLMVEPRVLFSRSSFSAHGERRYLLPSMYLTRSSDGLSHPSSSSSSSLSSSSRGISSQAWTPSPVSLRTAQSVVDGDSGISSSTSPTSFSSPSSSISLLSSLWSSSASSGSSSSSSPSSSSSGGGTVRGFETPIYKEGSAVASFPFSQVLGDDVNNKVNGEEGKDLSALPEQQWMSGSAAADRDLDGPNRDKGSAKTLDGKKKRSKTDEAAEIGYSLIGKIDPKDEPYSVEPKSVFAVVEVGSHQFKVTPGDVIYTEKLKIADVNDKVALEKVLLLGSVSKTIIGRPTIPGALVRAAIEEQALDAKVIIFKKKRRKNYRRTRGHRQMLSRLRILEIVGIEEDSSLSAGVQNVEPDTCDSQQEPAASVAAA